MKRVLPSILYTQGLVVARRKEPRSENMGSVGGEETEKAGSMKHEKNEYRRVDSEVNDGDPEDEVMSRYHQLERRRRTRRYVFACAVFASLNTVLLGYGKPDIQVPLFFYCRELASFEVMDLLLLHGRTLFRQSQSTSKKGFCIP